MNNKIYRKIKKFFFLALNKVFNKFNKLKGPANPNLKANIITRDQHGISRSSFSQNVLKVLYRLKNNGFDAYLVGGSIRDILLGIEPKDFDVVTNAKPNIVRRIFSNCRIIGKRFPIVHVYFKNEIIEVATLRAEPKINPTDHKQNKKHKHSEHGMILRDNVYGYCITDDVLRRDFTINALYYNIKDFSIIDYVGAIKDIETRTLRLIGDPILRYQEDPVRMLRVVRFAAKLDLNIAPETESPIYTQYKLLEHIAAARLFEEYKKLFLSGYSYKTFNMLVKFNLFNILFPLCKINIDLNNGTNNFTTFVLNSLQNTDFRISSGKTIAPGFLISVLLWEALNKQAQHLIDNKKLLEFEAYKTAADIVLSQQAQSIAFPRAITTLTKDIWILQLRLQRRAGKAASRVFNSPKFRASYDFLALRAKAGYQDAVELLDWWDKYIASSEKIRWQMAKALNPARKNKKN